MITVDEMKTGKLYSKDFYIPFYTEDKMNGSLIYLLTKSKESSLQLMRNKFMINKRYFESYYVEKDITYYINTEGFVIEADNIPYNILSESGQQYLNDPSNFVQALELNNFECSNTYINEDTIDDIINIEEIKILEGSLPKFLTTEEKQKLREMIIKKGEFYYNKISKNYSLREKEIKNPFMMKQSVKGLEFKRKYLNRDSDKCILGTDFDSRNDRLSIVYYKDKSKTYSTLFKFNSHTIKNIWLIDHDNLISLDMFINECVQEREIPVKEDTVIEPMSKKDSNLIRLAYTTEGYDFNKYYLRDNNTLIVFNEALENIEEASKTDLMLRKLLFKERLKNNIEVLKMYKEVKKEIPMIKYTYLDMKKYKGKNVFVDLQYYVSSFFRNNMYKLDKGMSLLFDFMTNMITRDFNIYKKKTIFLNLTDWVDETGSAILNYKNSINPLSILLRFLKIDLDGLKELWKDLDFIIFSNKTYMRININDLEEQSYMKLKIKFEKMINNSISDDDSDETEDSPKAIVANITDKLEANKKIKIHNLTGKSSEIDKNELVNKIEKAASTSNTVDDTLNKLEDDPEMKEIIATLQLDTDDGPNMNAARKARISKLRTNFLDKTIDGKSVRNMIEEDDGFKELPETALDIDCPIEDWQHLRYINFNKVYDLREDIYKIFYSFSKKKYPVVPIDISVEDTSTTEDYVETWTAKMEDAFGNRFTIKLDIPKLKDNQFMKLRGNEKTISCQEMLIPISKTDVDTVQIVSNYKKIFIRDYGTSVAGRRHASSDMFIKTINKSDLKPIFGDNTIISDKYELPIDYIDVSTVFSEVESKNYIFYFNQDEIRELYNIPKNCDGIPFGYDKKEKKVLYYDGGASTLCGHMLFLLHSEDSAYEEITRNCKLSNKYHYSQASILNSKIPLIIVMGYSEGLVNAMTKSKIHYEIVEKRPIVSQFSNFIKFQDAYIVYDNTIEASLLMNGLKDCPTEQYSISQINTKEMFVDFLELFGGRILSDGLDNFYDLEIDPITEEVLRDYKLTTDYIELLGHANSLLSDNKYIDHTDLTSNRHRGNELIAAYTYMALAESYGRYRIASKHSDKISMSIKQSQVIDLMMADPTAGDASILNPALEESMISAVSFKGLSGMNSDRSYTLDKRTFGDSMLNVLAMATGFAGNVGVTRQATMDMNVVGKRGYIKPIKSTKELSIAKTFCMTEALLPYAATHDDPFRLAMGFIQTSKHLMKTKVSCPQLITNGADMALPYMITNTFAFKAKEDGKIIELTDNYAIIEYNSGKHDFIDLRDVVKKNSNAGFFTSVKLSAHLKQGQKVHKDEILAYDEGFFSDMIGNTNCLAYNAGILVNVAILNTDEGFEDSAIVTEWLSHAMASNVTVCKTVTLPKSTNILNIAKKGQHIEEGDEILLFQNSYDEDDVNELLKSLSDDIDEITDLGKIPLRSKVTGIVKDIKVYRSVEKDELSDSLRKVVNDLEKETDTLSKVIKKYKIDYIPDMSPNYKLDTTGKMKNAEDCVKLEFYLEYEDLFSVGDKLIYYSAVKGVDKDIIKTGEEPYTDRLPNEPIDALIPLGGISARMVTCIENVVALNKAIIELDRCIKNKAGIKVKPLREKVKRA